MAKEKTALFQRQYIILVSKKALPEFALNYLDQEQSGYHLPMIYTVHDIPDSGFSYEVDDDGNMNFCCSYDNAKTIGYIVASDEDDLKTAVAQDAEKLKNQISDKQHIQEIKDHHNALSLAERITGKKKTIHCPKIFSEELESFLAILEESHEISNPQPRISTFYLLDIDDEDMAPDLRRNDKSQETIPVLWDFKKLAQEILSDKQTRCYAFMTAQKPVTL